MRSFGMTCMALLSVGALALVGCGDDSGSSGPSGPAIESCLGEFSTLPADFSAAGYAAANADLAAYFCTDGACDGKEECRALADHYVNNGAAEGRGYVPLAPSSSATAPSSASGQPTAKANRIGFLPYYSANARAEEIDFARYTQINAFSAKIDADGSLVTSDIDNDAVPSIVAFNAALDEARRRGVPVLLTVGGNNRSANMSTVFGNDGLRQVFVNSALAYVQSRGWQGIDIDWEFPTTEGDDAALTATMKALHDAFAPHGLKVSIDLPTDLHITSGKAKVKPDFAPYVDQINVMTYDYGATTYGPHDPNSKVFATMDYWIGQGLPADKLNMGIAFYGRDCRQDGGTQAPSITWRKAYEQTCQYVETAANCLGDRDGRFRARTYWVYGGGFVDGVLTLVDGWAERVDYLASHELAGFLYWEITQDIPLTDTAFPDTPSSLNFRIAAHIDELLQARGR